MAQHDRSTPYAWAELTRRWERDEITVEQLVGQLLVWSQQLHEMLVIGQREHEGVMQDLTDLDARLASVEEQLEQP